MESEVFTVSGGNFYVLTEDQYQGLVDHITVFDDKVDSFNESVDLFSKSVKKINCPVVVVSSSGMEVKPPEDFYNYISDVSGQSVFFLSLILGVLVFLCFVRSFK